MTSFGTVEPGIVYRPRPGGYAVVVNEGQVAVVHTPKGHFLPGGGAKGDESMADAAIRETKEETGLIITISQEIGTAHEYVHSAKSNKFVQKICSFYAAEWISRIDEWEPDHVLVWTSPTEAADLLTHGSQKWAVRRLFFQND